MAPKARQPQTTKLWPFIGPRQGLDLRLHTHQPREPTNGGNITTPNNDHLTAHDTYESVRDFFDPELQRQWDKVLRSTRRAAFAAAYDTIVNADPSADRREILNEAYWSTMEVYEATLGVLCDFAPDYLDELENDVPDGDVPDDV